MSIAGSVLRLAVACTASAGLLAAPSASAQVTAPGDPRPAGEAAAQISEYVRRIFQDHAGNLWFGTNSDGVCRYDGATLAYFSTEEGLAGAAVRGIVQSGDGAMWFATDRGVSRFHLGVFTTYTAADGLSDSDTWSMMLDRAGTLWVGTMGGVCRLKAGEGERFVPFPIPGAEVESPSFRFSPKLVWTMFEEEDGDVWFGTDGEGARRYDGESFTTYTMKDGLAGNQVRCILGDRRGRIWLCSSTGGVSCYDGKAFRNFTPEDGLGNERVYTMLEDRAGNLWFSTLGEGVTRYDGEAFTVFPGPLPRTHVQSMLEDKDGTLWFGLSGGLFRFDGTGFINVTRDGPWPAPSPPPPSPSANAADPMASFARLVGGEWKLTAPGMTAQMFDTWHWGPGRHSTRAMTDGTAADGNPWRALRVFYWHPGREEICLLGMSTFGRGVSEGTITFEGETADGVFDTHQIYGRRKLGLQWDFDGPDKYHDILLQETGPEGLKWMNAWDHIRSKGPPALRPPIAGEAPRPSERLRALEPLLGQAWEARGEWGGEGGGSFHIRTDFEWVPYAEVIYARTVAMAGDGAGEPVHLLDSYFYHHTGAGVLRCLALSSRGGVYEGDVTVLDGGGLELDLKGYEGDRFAPRVVRIDFEEGGMVRERVWSVGDTERTLVLDVHHKKIGPDKGSE